MFAIHHTSKERGLPCYTKVMEYNILITGKPGSRKSTLIHKLIRGKKFGGIATPDVRKGKTRFGFKVVDLKTGKEGILASVEIKPAVVSKYGVDVAGFEQIAIPAIEDAIEKTDLVVIDEIGKMECFSKKFKEVTERALDAKKVLASISLKSQDSFILKIKRRSDCRLFYLTKETFDHVYREVLKEM